MQSAALQLQFDFNVQVKITPVHAIILEQLGGRKFLTMTGSKHLAYSEMQNNYLSMHLVQNRSKAKYLRIELTVMDTYKMTFTKLSGKKYAQYVETIREIDNVYAEDLQKVFTEVTGLYTRLF